MTVTLRPFHRAPCPTCRVEYQVRVDGTVRAHRGEGGQQCLGSHRRPA